VLGIKALQNYMRASRGAATLRLYPPPSGLPTKALPSINVVSSLAFGKILGYSADEHRLNPAITAVLRLARCTGQSRR
jgi:hypothetical protein